jgi:hypothetical protein
VDIKCDYFFSTLVRNRFRYGTLCNICVIYFGFNQTWICRQIWLKIPPSQTSYNLSQNCFMRTNEWTEKSEFNIRSSGSRKRVKSHKPLFRPRFERNTFLMWSGNCDSYYILSYRWNMVELWTRITHLIWKLGYGLDDRGEGARFSAETRDFSLFQNNYTGSGAHLASYMMGTRHSFPRCKAVRAWSW